MRRIGIVGGGWAGLAAAIAATRAGHQVTLFEAARTLGGRARTLALPTPLDPAPLRLDNGQHILIGAYTECLALMRAVGVDVQQTFVRTPLALMFPDGTGLRLPDAPSPWDAVWGIATARGWHISDKLALLRQATRWRLQGFRCDPRMTVAGLCTGLPQRLIDEFIDPLCVSALNTPATQASGSVFLRVLHDSLFSDTGSSHLLLPRTDLGRLFPEAAQAWLEQQGALVHVGQRATAMTRSSDGWSLDGQLFDDIVLAASATEAARLVQSALPSLPPHEVAQAQAWIHQAEALAFTAITTVYAHAPGASLPEPMLALRPEAGCPAQFVFDRGQLGGPMGLLAFVVSASEGERHVIEAAVLHQARMQLNQHSLQPVQTIIEKRATFACTPGLERPSMAIATGLAACGDYVQGPYPATLEGAVRSARALF